MATATRSLSITVPDEMLSMVGMVIGAANASINRLIEAGFRAYQGQTKEQIQAEITNYRRSDLSVGGRKSAHIDETLLEGIEGDFSKAARIGLLMLMYGFSREQAEKFILGNPVWDVKMGRPRKDAEVET